MIKDPLLLFAECIRPWMVRSFNYFLSSLFDYRCSPFKDLIFFNINCSTYIPGVLDKREYFPSQGGSVINWQTGHMCLPFSLTIFHKFIWGMPKMLPLGLVLKPRSTFRLPPASPPYPSPPHPLYFFFLHRENERQRGIKIFTLENGIETCEKHRFGKQTLTIIRLTNMCLNGDGGGGRWCRAVVETGQKRDFLLQTSLIKMLY